MEITPKHIINNEDISTDFVIDISEILIDSILEEGIFKEIPFIKSVVALYKTGKSIKDYYSVKKLYAFLIGCQGIDKNKFNKLINSLEDEKTREDMGMRVLLVVDKVDEIKKAELIGRTLKLLADGQIDFTFYMRLCHMIEKCFYSDILALQNFKDDIIIIPSKNKIMDTIVLETLFSSGLISTNGFDGGNVLNDTGGIRYELNDYSIQLKRVL